MKEKKISFIGAGNMGGAILEGILKKELVQAKNIRVFDSCRDKVKIFEKKYGIIAAGDIKFALENSDIIVVAVKPNIIDNVLEQIAEASTLNAIVISIAAGVGIERMEKFLGKNAKIVRIMPNTPALVGAAMSSVSVNKNMLEEDTNIVLDIFNSLGKAELLDECMIDSVTGLSGSGPAYVYMFIEALADGAVNCGMPRDKAYKFAAQTVFGSAKMVLETGQHPGELKDMVTSPAGTTIEAVRALEKNNFRSAVIEAVIIAGEKSKEMRK